MLTMLENLLALHPWDSVEATRHATKKDPYATKWIGRHGDRAGHGPYTIEQWSPGDRVVFKAFADYHAGRPPVDRVVYRSVDSSATRLSLIKQGAVDVVRDLLPTEYESAAKADGVEVTSWRGARSRILVVIPSLKRRREFRDVRVRQALAYAAPYKKFVDDVYRGFASRWNGVIPQDFPLFTNEFWPYGDGEDVQQAKRLLAQAGYPNGFSVRMLYNSSLPEMEQNAILLQAAFAEIGVKLQLDKLSDAAFTQRYTGGQFELLLLDDLTLTPDIGYSTYLWFQTTSPQNVGGYSNKRVDRLSERILGSLDEEVRQQAGTEIQRLLVEDCPQIFLCQPHFTVAKRKGITGETATSARVLRFDDLKLA
jgi:peptide/nickel transport system substrate-binding protein